MPTTKLTGLSAACLACLLAAILATPALAGSTTAHLRVVNSAGATLADQSQVTGDVTIKTDPGAQCFGPPGGSGNNVTVPGPSALGIVKDASDTNVALRPLSVTDQFGFALGVCGIGGFTFSKDGFGTWYLKVNHVGASVGGDQYLLNAGDDVLWYLAPNYNAYPNELQIVAPALAEAGKPFTITVFSYDNEGRRSPVAGALVTGSQLPTAPTGADGTTTVQLTASGSLQAVHASDIPSGHAVVCVLTSQNTCGSPRNKIVGTKRKDRIRGTKLPDQIRARSGDDRVNVRGGLPDIVNCGRGRDKAIIGPNDLVRHCEKVIRKG
jgi:hypothetical protein